MVPKMKKFSRFESMFNHSVTISNGRKWVRVVDSTFSKHASYKEVPDVYQDRHLGRWRDCEKCAKLEKSKKVVVSNRRNYLSEGAFTKLIILFVAIFMIVVIITTIFYTLGYL